MLNAQGRTLWFDHSLVPVQDATGTVTQVIGISRDITDLLRAQHAIQEASKKINLLTSITRHDVANQVTILRGLAELAMKSTPDPDISSLLAKIDQAGAAIARHVEFTRTYQEIGMHAPEWFLLDPLAERLKPERVSLSGTCRTVAIFADPMLEKVFQNLFDNALRHGVRVTTITIRCTEGPGGLTVLFEDNGTGIRPEHKEKIFERGFGENTGMGLFLSREILEITGITIAETGTSGEGARFELHVPCGKYRIIS
jgi:signal transduction histidine kinase